MSKGKKLLLLALALAAIVVASLIWATPSEPNYQGRPLSAWMAELEGTNYEKRILAQAAIREMGAEAIPFLTNSLAQRDSPALRLYRKRILPNKLVQLVKSKVKWHSPVMESRNAALALRALGSPAAEAVPPLVAALEDPSPLVGFSAAEALGGIGAPALPALQAKLTAGRENPLVFYALGKMGTNAAPAVTNIAQRLDSPDGTIADRAAGALMSIGAASTPAAAKYLSATNAKTRIRGARVLRHLGLEAQGATNALQPLLSDPDPDVRYAAIEAFSMMRLPPEQIGPVWVQAIKDSNPRNAELALSCLAGIPSNVRSYSNEIAALVHHPEPSISALASNTLSLFRGWPKAANQ